MIPLIPQLDFIILLPPELSDSILSHLPISTLRTCALVSRQWHHLTTPHLYHTITLQTDDYFLQKFSQTLRANPPLAKLVRNLTFTLPEDHPQVSTPVSFFMQRCFEPLHNLRSISFDGPFAGFAERFSALTAKGVEFPELREVRMGSYVQGPQAVEAIWKVPRLEKLQMSIGGFNQAGCQFAQWPVAERLRSLELKTANMDYEDVSNLLSLAPGLRKLTFADYRNVNEFEGLPDCAGLHIEKLSNLEHLMLGIIKYSSTQNSPLHLNITPSHGFLHPMTSLTNLQKLDVSVQSLLGWYPEEAPRIADVIPTSLTELILNEDHIGDEDEALASEVESEAQEDMEMTGVPVVRREKGDGYKWKQEEMVGRLADLLRETKMGFTNIRTVEFGPLGERWSGEALDQLRATIANHGYKFQKETLEGHGQYLRISV